MAENDARNGQNNRHRKRLEEARKQGPGPALARAERRGGRADRPAAALHFLGGYSGGQLHGHHARRPVALPREQALERAARSRRLGIECCTRCSPALPLLGLTLVAALVAPLALGGWNLSLEALAPDFTRSIRSTASAACSPRAAPSSSARRSRKFLVVALVAVAGAAAEVAASCWDWAASRIAAGASRTPPRSTGHALLMLAGALGLIAAVDVPWQLWQHTQQLKMTREEMREEMKESEGSPEMKGRIRQAQRELARRRMMQEVPKADVVVINPTHFAVALRYDEKRMRAPLVVAKGADLIAARIREIATEHRVPIFEAPPLARALYPQRRARRRDPGLAVRRGRAGADLHLPAQDGAGASARVPPAPPDIDPDDRADAALRHEPTHGHATDITCPIACATCCAPASACPWACSRCWRWWCCRCRRSRSTCCSPSTSRCRS